MSHRFQSVLSGNSLKMLTAGSLIGLFAGIAVGVVAHETHNESLLALAAIVEPFGTIWINALRMLILPLIVACLFVAVAATADARRTGQAGGLSFMLFASLLAVGSIFTVLVGLPLVERTPLSSKLPLLHVDEADALAASASSSGFLDWIVGLVPPNPLQAAVNGEILPIVVMTLLFALAVTQIAPELRQIVIRFFKAVADATLVLVGWILLAIPVAVFAIALPLSAETGFAVAGAVTWFIIIVSALLFFFTLALYPLTSLLGGVSLARFARGVLPSQAVAVSTRSSLASLPALIEGAEKRMKLPTDIAGFVLPLSVSTFKVNMAISSPLKLMFLAHVYGIHLEPAYLVVFIITVCILSFGSPGLPSGSAMITLPYYTAIGIPIEGFILLKAVDAIPDIFKTVVNVTADMSVATVVARFFPSLARPPRQTSGSAQSPIRTARPAAVSFPGSVGPSR